MDDEEKLKQFCEKLSEILESESYKIEKIYEDFYNTIKLSKKDYEERCSFDNMPNDVK